MLNLFCILCLGWVRTSFEVVICGDFMKCNPKISAVITSYNRGNLLGETIDSFLAQNYSNLEIIIVDDGSTDNSREVIQRFAARYPDKIKYIFQENRGPSIAASRGIGIAEGDFIALSSNDDVSCPDRIGKTLTYLQQNPQVGIVCTHVSFIDEDSKPVLNSLGWWGGLLNHPNRTRSKMLLHFLRHGNYLASPTALVRKEVFEKTGPFHPASLQAQDFILIVRALEFYEIHLLEDKLVNYRVYLGGGNLSSPANELRGYNEWNFIAPDLLRITCLYADKLDLCEELRRNGVDPSQEWPIEFLVFKLAMLPNTKFLYPSAIQFIAKFFSLNPQYTDLIKEFNRICAQADTFGAVEIKRICNSRAFRTGQIALAPARALRNFGKKLVRLPLT